MAETTFYPVSSPDERSYVEIIEAQYSTGPEGTRCFVYAPYYGDEFLCIFVAPDGSAFGTADSTVSETRAAGDFAEGISEFYFEPGTFDPTADSISTSTSSSLY